ncbi:MAG: TIGR03905 family TSCPD domain-containing protein [Deltaproteobacteria bacterium]|jgi:uncharacterized protein (TIGR03905 family)|nr:TIGR03905 family TSCPD domain-containing protein [Deltaproteobacteria bacterium]
MRHEFVPKKICPKAIAFDIEDGILSNVSFDGGCNGNLKGIGRLTEGRDALEVAGILSGLTCGKKDVSCPSELSRAIYKAMGKRPPRKPTSSGDSADVRAPGSKDAKAGNSGDPAGASPAESAPGARPKDGKAAGSSRQAKPKDGKDAGSAPQAKPKGGKAAGAARQAKP